jgi:hypothetical protein
MTRMQQPDGSALSIKGHAGASPPSADSKPCMYGTASTSASFSTAAALGYASLVYKAAPGVAAAYPGYASGLGTKAQSAWTWAVANPNVTFYNKTPAKQPITFAGGEQEVNAAGLLLKKIIAAVYLFELTGTGSYQQFVDANYTNLQGAFDSSHMDELTALLDYAFATGATASVSQAILSNYKGQEGGFFSPQSGRKDPYGAWVPGYWWGDNATKSGQGDLILSFVVHPTIDGTVKSADAYRFAEGYVHYIDGVNPLQLVYLSAMGAHGAEKFVTRFFHTWFAHGSVWDQAGVSKYGPPPGYLTGGANPAYTWDGCCPGGCGAGNNCGAAPLSPPSGQPAQKSYLDFNDNWPLDSWSVTEPDVGYQAVWVRLLSKFVQ